MSGHYFNCALDIAGLISCWGDDQDSKVSDAPTGVYDSVYVGVHTACALDVDGMASCWGSDEDGIATPPTTSFSSLSIGHFHIVVEQ